MKFDVAFFDDSRIQCYFSILARDETDARIQVTRNLPGRRGSGVMRQVAQRHGAECVGKAISFQIGRGDTQDGDAA